MKKKKPPFELHLTPDYVTDPERGLAMQTGITFAQTFGLPVTQQFIKPLVMAFTNGIAYARAYERLTVKERKRLDKYHMEVWNEINNTPDPTLN